MLYRAIMETGGKNFIFGLTLQAGGFNSARNQARKISQGCKVVGIIEIPSEMERICAWLRPKTSKEHGEGGTDRSVK